MPQRVDDDLIAVLMSDCENIAVAAVAARRGIDEGHKAGMYYDLWKQHKSEIYRDPLLPLINSKRIRLPRNDRLINQA